MCLQYQYSRNIPGVILLGIIIAMIIGIPLGVTEFKGILLGSVPICVSGTLRLFLDKQLFCALVRLQESHRMDSQE